MSRTISLCFIVLVYFTTVSLASLPVHVDVGSHPTQGQSLRWDVILRQGNTRIVDIALKRLDNGSITVMALTSDISEKNGEYTFPQASPGTYVLQFIPVSKVTTEAFEASAPYLVHAQATPTFPSPSGSASDTSTPQPAVQKSSFRVTIMGGILGGILFIGIKGHLLLYRHRRLRKKKSENDAEKHDYPNGHVQPFTALRFPPLGNSLHLNFSSDTGVVSGSVHPSSAASLATSKSRLGPRLATIAQRPARNSATHIVRFLPPVHLPTPEQTNSKGLGLFRMGFPRWERGRAQEFVDPEPNSANSNEPDNIPEITSHSMHRDSLNPPTISDVTNRAISEELALLREQIRRLEARQEQLFLRGENTTNTEPPPGYEGTLLPLLQPGLDSGHEDGSIIIS